MSDLAEFLHARIAEDEALARDAYYDGQRWAPEEEAVVLLDQDLESVLYMDRKRDAQHAANWSPARVLAECEAKRRIIELQQDNSRPHKVPLPWPDGDVIAWKCRACGAWCNDGPDDGECPVDWREPPMVLRALALPYADHPDFRPEWRL